MSEKTYKIYGIHPVLHVLQNDPKRIVEIETTAKIKEKYNIDKCKIRSFAELNQFYPDLNHQSLICSVKAKRPLSLEDIISNNENDKITILDSISDVGNCGAIIRSAVAFGCKKIIFSKHHSLNDYSKLAKASAGLSELCDIVEVTNLVKAVDSLKKHNYWIISLAGDGASNIKQANNFKKIVTIFGNEHKGIKRLIKKHSDLIVKIPTASEVESLNVSACAAITFFHFYN